MIKIPRGHIPGAIFYVTARGDHNEDIFKDGPDYATYLGLLKKYKEYYGFKLFAYCLLQNHLHLLIELKENLTISEIMHDLSANYTKYFNSYYQKKGHLFQERYKLIVAEKEQYLLPLLTYIHLAPKLLDANIDLPKYRYSSYPAYLGERGEALDLDAEVKEAGELLKISDREMQLLKEELAKRTILGSAKFIEEAQKAAAKQGSAAENLLAKQKLNKLVLTGSLVIIILGVFTLYIYTKTESKAARATKQIEDEYQTKMDANYREMVKHLQVEKQKAEYLQEKLQGEAVQK